MRSDTVPQGAAGDPPPLAPTVAAALFGPTLPTAVRYASWLAGAGVERGLIGPRETERLWLRHLLNCVAVAALIPTDSHVVDIGSGAGLPGIVLAIARPDVRVTLVEPMQRRIAFLDEVRADLALGGVATRRARAEDLATARLDADFVTARAVAPVSRLAELAAPLLRVGGQLLALKGSAVVTEVSTGWAAVQRVGMNVDAALFAILATDHVTLAPGTSNFLPGVQIAELSAWQSDGILCEGESATSPLSAAPLALVLRLGQSGRGSARRR